MDFFQPTPTNLVITNITVSTSQALIEWFPENNISYQLQSSTNLMTNLWSDVGGWVLSPNNSQTNSATATSQYYRVTVPFTP